MKMRLDVGYPTIEKDFNAHMIVTYRLGKDGRLLSKPSFCRLSKHSKSVIGYMHQLQLDGFKVVKELEAEKYLHK